MCAGLSRVAIQTNIQFTWQITQGRHRCSQLGMVTHKNDVNVTQTRTVNIISTTSCCDTHFTAEKKKPGNVIRETFLQILLFRQPARGHQGQY